MSTPTPSRPDPREAYPRPPFKNQEAMEMPGTTAKMNPTPDHGENSYRGTGRLQGCVALITGGDSGIGRAVALAYAREGADLVINYLSESADAATIRQQCEAEGRTVHTIEGDLRDESFCNRLVEQTIKKLGKLDLLVNNAAYQEVREDIEAMDTALFDRIMKTNVYAPFWLSRAALPKMEVGGAIINTASIQGYDPSPMLLPYAVTKSALLGMTKALAGLAIKRGVRVNAVAPGPVWTPLIPGSMPLDKVKKFGQSTAFERPAQPAELAPLYVWLASPEASYVTGEVYGATGGKSPV